MNKTAVFIDIMSIQKYIFSSNQLKDNIGASHIIESIFDELKEKFEYSYAGGGSALIYFNTATEAKNAMKEWSANLLQTAPGIVPFITIEENFDTSTYAESRKRIINKSIKQKNEFIPITALSAFGITADCPKTGLSSEIFCEKCADEDISYLSSVSYTKILKAEEANNKIRNYFKDILNNDDNGLDKYEFPDKFDEMGGTKDENNHIAVVHIDGNDMGLLFKQQATEEEIKKLSAGLTDSVKSSFKQVLQKLIPLIDKLKYNREITLKEKKANNGKLILLPVRPIVLGGDDVTFVCDARIGLWCATEFIKAFELQDICRENKITACGGVSIVKTNYPFYRAYKMAEDLCNTAKKKRRNESDNSAAAADSYIDFHISFGGMSDSIDRIRIKNYKSADNKLLYKRPYKIKEIPKLLNCIKELKEKLPQSKIKKFREVLYSGKIAAEEFIKELNYRGNTLPVFSHSDEAKKGFSDDKSPYIDIIELMDFYPLSLISKEDL
jgi:hypothetical protein